MTVLRQPKEFQPPLVVHIIFRLATGGLENGLVNLINRTPRDRYRHAIVCLKDSTDFRGRIQHQIPIVALHKRGGQDLASHMRLWRTLHELRPTSFILAICRRLSMRSLQPSLEFRGECMVSMDVMSMTLMDQAESTISCGERSSR